MLEAFLLASGRTAQFYQSAGRLVTEHALLDDTGDGTGTPADAFVGVRPKRPNAATPADGPRAHQWTLRPTAGVATLPPEVLARRDRLEAEIEALRGRKSTLPPDAYYAELERLMIDLARTQP